MLGVEEETLRANEVIRALLGEGRPALQRRHRDVRQVQRGDQRGRRRQGQRRRAGGRRELECRVVGEGGNLGFTQRGRVEYALGGGRIYMDAIDNSAGVDCSDHEVNIKILLDSVVEDGDMTEKQRNELLVEMTEEVGQLVLRDNYEQTRAISNALALAHPMIDVHIRYIRALEQAASTASSSSSRATRLWPNAGPRA